MANDPNGDLYNVPATYSACSAEPTCINYTSQPQGTFIWEKNSSNLGSAFLQLASQILRLSHDRRNFFQFPGAVISTWTTRPLSRRIAPIQLPFAQYC